MKIAYKLFTMGTTFPPKFVILTFTGTEISTGGGGAIGPLDGFSVKKAGWE